MRTALAYVPSPGHVYPDHPESPKRFDRLASKLESLGASRITPTPASREAIERVHGPAFVQSLEETCGAGEAIIDFAPTFVTRSSFRDALLAAGATIDCTRAVLTGSAENAIAIVRPPGHHAEPERAMGFCLFNNIAVAARDALEHGVERIAIVDFDAHHGNGTEAAFLAEDRVAYLSTHQWGIYPGSGWIDEVSAARGRIVNVPLPAGSGDAVFGSIGDTIITPFLERFKPQLVMVSAGFDAHWNDPITNLGLSTRGFHELAARLVNLSDGLCGGRIVFVLEGGYDPGNVLNGVQACLAALRRVAFADPGDAAPHSEPDARRRLEDVRTWNDL